MYQRQAHSRWEYLGAGAKRGYLLAVEALLGKAGAMDLSDGNHLPS